MSAPVDVLAVLDTDGRAVALYADTCSDGGLRKQQWVSHLAKHDEARAAVAELIEAAHASLHWESGDGRTERQRLRAALARVQGGA